MWYVFFFLDSDSTKDGVVTADRGAVLLVLLAGVADREELGGGGEHTSSEPDGVSLHFVGDDVDVDGLGLDAALTELSAALDAVVDDALDVSLQAAAKVLEHGGSSREDDVLVEGTTGVDGAVLDGVVDDGGEGSQKVRAVDLGAEEDLRAEEALVTDIDGEGTLGDRVLALVELDGLGRGVVLLELLGEVGADVAVVLLDALGDLERLGGWDLLLSTLTHEVLHKAGHITTGNGDVLNATSNDVTLSLSFQSFPTKTNNNKKMMMKTTTKGV
jgi:hypothetical protein